MKTIHFYTKKSRVCESLKEESCLTCFECRTLKIQVINNGYVLVSKGWSENGRIVTGGVLDNNKNYIPESAYAEGLSCGYDFDDSDVDVADKCIYIGFFHNCYGHGITDTQKKLWFLHTSEGKELLDEGVDVVFITTANTDMSKWHLRLLELAGVEVSRIKHIRKTTKYKQIIIPDNSITRTERGVNYCDEYRKTINHIKRSVEQSVEFSRLYPDNIYFTRTAINDVWREMGEKALEIFFKKMGFSIISPEQHSLEEQISMLMKCKRFVATEGSCSHAEIFCRQDAEVTILRKADYLNRYSIAIADFANCKTVFVDANHSTLANKEFPWRGPFYLTITKELREYTGLNGGLPYCLRLTYCLYKYQYTTLGKHLLFFYYLSLILRRKLKGLL